MTQNQDLSAEETAKRQKPGAEVVANAQLVARTTGRYQREIGSEISVLVKLRL